MSDKTTKSFDKRAFTSVFVGFAFIMMAVTGLALFFAPSCRIARDTSWSILGHSKEILVAVHVWFCLAFVISAVYHTYLNWRALTNYFKTKLKKGLAFRVEWVTPLIICLVIYVGTIRGIAPFSSLIAWKDIFKYGASGGAGYGQHGGKGGGYRGGGDPNRTVTHGVQDSNTVGRGHRGEEEVAYESRRGMGQMTLKEFCESEGIELSWAIRRLQDKGFMARQTMTMREIANRAGVHPRQLRDVLQAE